MSNPKIQKKSKDNEGRQQQENKYRSFFSAPCHDSSVPFRKVVENSGAYSLDRS